MEFRLLPDFIDYAAKELNQKTFQYVDDNGKATTGPFCKWFQWWWIRPRFAMPGATSKKKHSPFEWVAQQFPGYSNDWVKEFMVSLSAKREYFAINEFQANFRLK